MKNIEISWTVSEQHRIVLTEADARERFYVPADLPVDRLTVDSESVAEIEGDDTYHNTSERVIDDVTETDEPASGHGPEGQVRTDREFPTDEEIAELEARDRDPDDVADLVAHDAAAGLPGFTPVGRGTNIAERVAAGLHHVDAPFTPVPPEPKPGTLAWIERTITGASPATQATTAAVFQVAMRAAAEVLAEDTPHGYVDQARVVGRVTNALMDMLTVPAGEYDDLHELYPAGRTLFYEGDDPREFAADITEELGFNPRRHPHFTDADGWQFHCPPYSLNALYEGADAGRWIFGS